MFITILGSDQVKSSFALIEKIISVSYLSSYKETKPKRVFNDYITPVSKKLGQSAVAIHYCTLSQFF